MSSIERIAMWGNRSLRKNYKSVRKGSKRARSLIQKPFSRVYYIVESQNWSIHWDGAYITKNTRELTNTPCDSITEYDWITKQVVHFGSRSIYFQGGFERVHPSNRIVVTWFHGDISDQNFEPQIRMIPDRMPHLDKVVTSSNIGRDKLLSWGVPEKKLSVIPLGIDLSIFRPTANSNKASAREQLGIPPDSICVGSFQKDGVGWGSGLEPKMVKGPDIFLKAIEKLRNHNNIFVLLTGPSRGYVLNGLEKLGVPYIHNYLENYHDIVQYFHCLDLYLVTSRDEGGPKAILECMATGVPIVSTRVGMAPDVIIPGENGMITDSEDFDGIADAAQEFIDHQDFRQSSIENGLRTAQAYDWSSIAMRYYQDVYDPLLGSQER